MQGVKALVGEKGDISLPAEYRKALDLKPRDEVLVRLDNWEMRIIPVKMAVIHAQELVRRYVPAGAKLVESLIRDRGLEAARE